MVKTLHVQSSSATVHAAATAKKQRPVLSSRHSEDDLKSGDYEYITEDSAGKSLRYRPASPKARYFEGPMCTGV